ncbi:putative metal-binding motif-containing protein [Candidatus Micrarchaeota archaeon]|nr:putative metal-binding motif-containing protein [Candidatus Micrarchaeota archaeon]MBU2476079.1 putative metal-binding motif-containing protein [Candidatus Micrarchaeota archaeon]
MKKLMLVLGLILVFGFVSAECVDSDGDGYGKTGLDCMFSASDCDDSNPNKSPGKTEVCGNRIDEDCTGKDKSCVQCNQGTIYFRCSCGGNVYENGYCCDNVFQSESCELCLDEMSDIKDCITEEGCQGKNVCFGGGYTICRDYFDDNCPCIEEWRCNEWSEYDCVNGKLVRECIDKKNCGTIKFKPGTERNCLTEEKKLQVLLSAETIKENETIFVTVLYQGNPVSSATIQYAGRSFQTSGLGKANLTAVFGATKIKASKSGFDSVELNINVIKSGLIVCGDNYCDLTENETSCPEDCKGKTELILPKEVFEGEEFSVKVLVNSIGVQGKRVVYSNQIKYTDNSGKTVFIAEKGITSVSLFNGTKITKNFIVIEKNSCGDKKCSSTENKKNCPEDCSAEQLIPNTYIFIAAGIVIILFAVALLTVK